MNRTAICAITLTIGACRATPGLEPDAGTDGADAALVDARLEARWTTAEPIAELASAADERFGAPVENGLVIYFTRTEMIGSFVVNVPYAASRPSLADDFGAPVRPVAWGATSIWDQDLTDDQLEWFFWRGLGQLGRAARASVSEPWSFPADIGIDGLSPSISSDRLSLYFVDRTGAIAVSRRDAVGAPFAPPSIIPIAGELPIASIDVTGDELGLLITADPASADAGIYLAARPSTDAPFARPEPIESLAGPFESARFRADEHEIVAVLRAGGVRGLYRSYLIEQEYP